MDQLRLLIHRQAALKQLMLEGNKGHLAKNTSLFCLVKQPFEQHIRNQRGIQLVKDHVRCRAKQHRHIQVLLNPVEKRFNRPARFVHLGHFFSRHIHQAGHDADFPLVVILEKHNPVPFFRTGLWGAQAAGDVAYHTRACLLLALR